MRATGPEKLAAVFARLSIPISLKRVVGLIGSWSIGRASDLAPFFNLKETYGGSNVDFQRRRYEDAGGDATTDSAEYLSLLDKESVRLTTIDLRMLKDAAMNVLMVIFILHDMDHKLQYEMIEAVERCFDYLGAKDFGIRNPDSATFLRMVIGETFASFQRIRTTILGMRDRSEAGAIVAAFRKVPDTSRESPIGRTFTHYDQANSALVVADWAKAAGTPASGATVDVNAAAKAATKAAKKAATAATALQRANDAKNKLAAATTAAAVAAQTAANGAGVGERRRSKRPCISFNSTAACTRGDQCRFSHFVPDRQSDDGTMISDALTDRTLAPAADFRAAK